jgi:hypothetical protein
MYGVTTLDFNTIRQYEVSINDPGLSCLNFVTAPTITNDNYWYDANTTVTVAFNGRCGTTTYLHLYTLNGTPTTVAIDSGSVQILRDLRIQSEQTITTMTVSATNGIGFVLILIIQLILFAVGLVRGGSVGRAAFAFSGISGLYALYQVYGFQFISFANTFFVINNLLLLPFWIFTIAALALTSLKSLRRLI